MAHWRFLTPDRRHPCCQALLRHPNLGTSWSKGRLPCAVSVARPTRALVHDSRCPHSSDLQRVIKDPRLSKSDRLRQCFMLVCLAVTFLVTRVTLIGGTISHQRLLEVMNRPRVGCQQAEFLIPSNESIQIDDTRPLLYLRSNISGKAMSKPTMNSVNITPTGRSHLQQCRQARPLPRCLPKVTAPSPPGAPSRLATCSLLDLLRCREPLPQPKAELQLAICLAAVQVGD